MAEAPVAVAHAFIAAINVADLDSLRTLMTEDHTFTDARGNSFSGAEKMVAGWQYFFEAFPQYWIHIDHSFADAHRVGLFGKAGGRWRVGDRVLPGSWQTPAAWLAEIENDRVKHWTVFCDTSWATPPPAEAA